MFITIKKVYLFYKEGFAKMTIGKTLWIIIIIKLFVLFFVLKIFFFKNFLNTKFDNTHDKGKYVLENLTQ